MTRYQFIDCSSVKDDSNAWVDFFCKNLHYSELYRNTIDESSLYPLCTNKAMLDVVKRLKQAQENHDKVIIFGDYDCDGVCATTIMDILLDYLHIDHGFYIPNRFSEGYGLNNQRIKQAYDKGYNLLITVDNGIVAYPQLEYAFSLGMDIIVTDHHTIDQPLDYLVLHPSLLDELYHDLCGSGVVYELSRHFVSDHRLDILAMIATIGDMMPLENENRRIVRYGLKQLSLNAYPAITQLINKTGMIDAKDIAFTIVPKINAIGRMESGNPNHLPRYLKSNDIESVMRFSLLINDMNEQRKSIVKQEIDSLSIVYDDVFIIAQSKTINAGLVGLVAGNLCALHHKPVFVFSLKEETVRCSARSVESCNIYDYVKSLNLDYLSSFGGHAQALGLSVSQENYDQLLSDLISNQEQCIFEKVVLPLMSIHATQVTPQLMDALKRLEPYDKSHPSLRFLIKQPNVVQSILLKEKYPKLTLDTGLQILSFKFQDFSQVIHHQWILTLNENVFNGKINIQAMVDELL